MLRANPTNSTKTVGILVGSNDSNDSVADIFANFKEIVQEAKRVASETVFINSILPRLKGDNYQSKADEVNEKLTKLCQDEGCRFVNNNNNNFRLLNSDIDDSLLTRDKIHLNERGMARLVENMGL